MFDNKWQKKEMPLVSLIGMGGGIASPAFLASIVLNILKPTVFSPVDDTGVPDFDYTAESSAITDISTIDTLGDAPAFNTTIWTGNSSTQIIDSGIDNTAESLVWIKNRDGADNHRLFDTIRGPEEILSTNGGWYSHTGTSSELSEFTSTGFDLGPSSGVNYNTHKYVSWNFRSEPGFFDAVTWTGDGSGTRDINHSLGSAPAIMIWKKANATSDWSVYHKDAGTGYNLYLNTTNSKLDTSLWGTGPTTTNFPAHAAFNLVGEEYVAYLFADNPSNQIKCGSYLGNAVGGGSPTVPNQIDCGFRPKFVLIKNAGNDTNWLIFDDQRGNKWLKADVGESEGFSSDPPVLFNDNGFSLPTGYHHVNQNNTEHIYLAIGSPKVTVSNTQLTLTDTTVSRVSDGSLIGGTSIDQVLTVGETVQADTAIASTAAAPVFTTTLYNGNGQSRDLDTGIDNTDKSLIWFKNIDLALTYPHILIDTVRGFSRLSSNNDQPAHSSGIDVTSFNDSGVSLTNATGWVNHPSGHDMVAWNFRAAPEFFDIVEWNASDLTTGDYMINHNLGTAPGMIICKNTDNSNTNWYVYHKDSTSSSSSDPNAHFLYLNQNREVIWSSGMSDPNSDFGGWAVTDTQFRASGSMHLDNGSDDFIAYVFADDTPGKIKCGTYTGTGSSSQTIDCGFEAGFVLIKAVDRASDWVVTDYKLMASGQFLHPNNEQELKTNAIVGSASNGFTVASGSGDVNNNGTTHIYMAIAKDIVMDITTEETASGTVSASTGNTITLSNTTGTWSTGMKVQGTDSDTKDNPSPISSKNVSLTSSTPTAERNVSTWGDAVWEIATDENFTQNVQTATTALSATGTQAGPSFVFEKETGYYARTKYTALGQESEWSDVTYFVTAPSVYVDDVFSTYLYTGNGSSTSSTQTINNGIDISGEGGLVWIKNRDATTFHQLFDTERGAGHYIKSNNSTQSQSGNHSLSSFNSNGFTLSWNPGVNGDGQNHVSWTFRKAPGFFDIVSYTGDGAGNIGREISHNLGSAPGMIMIKNLGNTDSWFVFHKDARGDGGIRSPEQSFLMLDGSNRASHTTEYWGNELPGSNSFKVGGATNHADNNYIAYIFAHNDQSFGTNGDESIIKCGSYTGESEWATPLEINLGFEPQFVLIKDTEDARDWVILDAMRGWTGSQEGTAVSAWITANTDNTESLGTFGYLTPTGFVVKSSSFVNGNNNKFIYMAIRRPHKPPTSATEVFKPILSTSQTVSVDFPTDLIISSDTTGGATYWVPRLTEERLQSTDTASGENMSSYYEFDLQNSFSTGSFWGGAQKISYHFKRAPGFFDVVAYDGTGSTTAHNHNLGVTPELLIVKNRTHPMGYDFLGWHVYNSADGASEVMQLNATDASDIGNSWAHTAPTSTHFTTGTGAALNSSGATYVAYLFASQPGISKVGTYTGTGNTINVDCGFTAGARFVMIKRRDSTGHWYVWDTARGIINSIDPYTLLNTSAADVTNTDYIDPFNSGFTVTSSGQGDLNANGGTYLFLAIA